MLKVGTARLVFVLLFLALGCFTAIVRGQPNRRVLLLHSYHAGMTWVDDITSGVSEVLTKDQANVYFQVDYMDTKHNSGPEYLEMLYELFRQKYTRLKFDCVLTADDAAFRFLLEHRQELFHEAPVVFCGLNDYTPDLLAGQEDVTGIVEQGDLTNTLELALRLHPHARQLAVITDSSEAGRLLKRQVQNARKELTRPVQFLFFDNLPMSVIADRMALLPSDCIVYLGPCTVDVSGLAMDPAAIVRTLRLDLSQLPIYTTSRSFLGRGPIGG